MNKINNEQINKTIMLSKLFCLFTILISLHLQMTTNQTGILNELLVAAHYVELGYSVSIPCGNKESYDMIIDDKKLLRKVQVKTPVYNKERNTISINLVEKNKYNTIDYITCYIKELDKFIQIRPIANKTSITIHISEHDTKNVMLLKNYII